MSKAKTEIKVLRTAHKRVEERWGKGHWAAPTYDSEGEVVWKMCLEGAIFGGNVTASTKVQQRAVGYVLRVLHEEYGFTNIPDWNDHHATKDDVLRVLKLTIIRLETGGFEGVEPMDPEEAARIAREARCCNQN